MDRRSIGSNGLLTAAAIALGMMVVSLILFPHITVPGNKGICIPSPNLWLNHYPATWILNTVLLFACGMTMLFCNKKFNFVQGNGIPMTMAFLVLCGGNPFVSMQLCTSTVLGLVNVVALWMLFETYRSHNATQEYFLIATFFSVGSMFQYSFVPMALVYPLGGILLKSLRMKECAAYLMGLAAPYWIGLGLGLLSPADFHAPALTNFFTSSDTARDLLIMLVGSGVFFLICALLSLNNAVRLYAGNSRIRHLNNTVNIMGYLSFICILADFSNLTAYLVTLYIWMGVQVGNLFALNHPRHPHLLLWTLAALYIAQYVLITVNFF